MSEPAPDYPKAIVFLLEEARQRRANAHRARRLAQTLVTQDAYDKLVAYAAELEQRAQELDEWATALAATVARTHALSDEIHSLVTEARARLKDMPLKKPPVG
ncbi:MAG TPA: hypothetical protein VN668_13005 [Stellaceae bacterium]|nr:hypothetical protein [Stellaceae bacterium]